MRAVRDYKIQLSNTLDTLKLDTSTQSGYSVEYVSEKVISSLTGSDRQLVLAPLYVRIAIIIRTVWPALYRYIMNRRAVKEKKNK